MSGLLGPQATFSSRYRMLKKEHFWVPYFPFTLDDGTVLSAPPRRDPDDDRRALAAAKDAKSKTKAAEILQARGLSRESRLWPLRMFAKHFWQHQAICRLHAVYEGNYKAREFTYVVLAHPTKWQEFNRRVSQYPKYKTLLQLGDGPVRLYTSRKTGAQRLSLDHMVGEQVETLIQISELCLLGIITDLQMKSLSLHNDYTVLLQAESYDEIELKAVGTGCMEWKVAFRAAYGGVPGCSFAYPNLDTEDAWPDQIRYLGPPHDQCTSLFEHEHAPTKCIGSRHSNQRNIEKTILRKRDREVYNTVDSSTPLRGADLVQIVPSKRHVKTGGGYTATGKSEAVAERTRDDLRALLRRHGVTNELVQVSQHTGFRVEGVAGRSGDHVMYQPTAGVDPSGPKFAQLQAVFRCRIKNISKAYLVASVQSFAFIGHERMYVGGRNHYPLLEPGNRELLPLGFGMYMVRRIVSVVEHPLHAGLFLHNIRIRAELEVPEPEDVVATPDSSDEDSSEVEE
eukprot:TRINITY_DN1716_c0_g1_i13.p1 TRINITY_DN1716_c0_g1~~TRINITY_DN1716_c0_g1_i13.p1  ORF type:complete len:511 (+),score=24.19 TRINITY_DN1716_c0_g1_i13:1360-2892(+)